jgi:hypothetical protein
LNICVEIEKEEMEHIKKFKNLENKSPPIKRMNLLVQVAHEEESEEYFIPLQNPICNEDNRL